MKRILKLDRLRLRGLSGAKDEVLLTATAQNSRISLLPEAGENAPRAPDVRYAPRFAIAGPTTLKLLLICLRAKRKRRLAQALRLNRPGVAGARGAAAAPLITLRARCAIEFEVHPLHPAQLRADACAQDCQAQRDHRLRQFCMRRDVAARGIKRHIDQQPIIDRHVAHQQDQRADDDSARGGDQDVGRPRSWRGGWRLAN
jgi:hypothetical protein